MTGKRPRLDAFVRAVTLLREKVKDFDRYPFDIPAIRSLETLELHPKVTFRLQLKKWDSAAHLETEADIARYWEACLEEGRDDPSFITTALGNIARARGMTRLARKTGLTREGLYKALSPDGNPEFGTVMKVIRALGLQLRGATAKG